MKGYNESSCLPLFREVEHKYTEIRYRKEDEEKPGYELQRMPRTRPAIYPLLLVHDNCRRSPRRSCRTVPSMNRSHCVKSALKYKRKSNIYSCLNTIFSAQITKRPFVSDEVSLWMLRCLHLQQISKIDYRY